MREITLTVHGTPIPKGSAKGFVIRGTNRCIITQNNRDKQKPWASAIQQAALDEVGNEFRPVTSGVFIKSMLFYFNRPKSHYGSGKNANTVKASAPLHHVTKPDLDKLERCALDALTGIIWKDDSQVYHFGEHGKEYSDFNGMRITIQLQEDGHAQG